MEFKREKKEDIANPGQVKVVYKAGEFSITANSKGVYFNGHLAVEYADNVEALEPLAVAISNAYVDYTSLRKAARERLTQ